MYNNLQKRRKIIRRGDHHICYPRTSQGIPQPDDHGMKMNIEKGRKIKKKKEKEKRGKRRRRRRKKDRFMRRGDYHICYPRTGQGIPQPNDYGMRKKKKQKIDIEKEGKKRKEEKREEKEKKDMEFI